MTYHCSQSWATPEEEGLGGMVCNTVVEIVAAVVRRVVPLTVVGRP